MGILGSLKQKLFGTPVQNDWVKTNFDNGYKEFVATGETPDDGYKAMIKLYCSTNGAFNYEISDKLSQKNKPIKPAMPLQGALGSYDQNKFKVTQEELDRNGYAFFDKKISAEQVKQLLDLSFKLKASIPPDYTEKIAYDPANPKAEIYRYDPNDLLNEPVVQSLLMDPVLINIARNYLGCEPMLTVPAMWWSTSLLQRPSEEAAQLYHFDLDRFRWLKFFVYLTDVNSDNGPHCYVKATHKPGAKPQELLNRGYVRISDEDLKKHYREEDFVEITAEAGTMFAGDTMCYHKGKPLSKGDRLVFEIEYANSLFGAHHPKLYLNRGSEDFIQFCKQNPVFATGITINHS